MTGVGDKSSCEPGNLGSIAFFPGLLSASGPSHGACSTWDSAVGFDCHLYSLTARIPRYERTFFGTECYEWYKR